MIKAEWLERLTLLFAASEKMLGSCLGHSDFLAILRSEHTDPGALLFHRDFLLHLANLRSDVLYGTSGSATSQALRSLQELTDALGLRTETGPGRPPERTAHRALLRLRDLLDSHSGAPPLSEAEQIILESQKLTRPWLSARLSQVRNLVFGPAGLSVAQALDLVAWSASRGEEEPRVADLAAATAAVQNARKGVQRGRGRSRSRRTKTP